MGWKKRVLLLIETSRRFGRNIINGVSRRVAENRNWNLYFQDRGVWEELPENVEHLDCDGIISRCSTQAAYEKLRSLNVPMVELLGDEETFFPDIRNDEETNCMMAARYFFERGFQHFAFFSVSDTPWARQRRLQFSNALKNLGVPKKDYVILTSSEDMGDEVRSQWGWWQGNEQDILNQISHLPKPLAVLCDWDMSAFYLMNICNSNSIMIPEEVAVLGYGNNADLCISSSPTLSSVAVNGREVGYQAAILLEKKFMNESISQLPIVIPATHIAERMSTQIVGTDNPIVAKAVGYIRENIARHPNVSDVAKDVGVSKTTLCRLFRKWKNCSPDEEILRRCIDWACELLVETDFSIGKIAHFLHYCSSASFIRTFKRETGMTPVEFRNNTIPGKRIVSVPTEIKSDEK